MNVRPGNLCRTPMGLYLVIAIDPTERTCLAPGGAERLSWRQLSSIVEIVV